MSSVRWSFLIPLMASPFIAAADDDRPAPKAIRADFKIAVWYRRDRPLETFKYQAYDMRKGEYSPAVDAWLKLLRTRYPAYEVHVRDVVLAREKGATDALRVGSVIYRDLLAAAAMEGVVLGEFAPRIRATPPSGLPPAPRILGGSRRALPAPPYRIDLGPPPPSFPVPMPYPRPFP